MKLELKNIHKSFGDNRVLKDVSLTLNGGEVLALIGENGAGKSTLMNILGGVVFMDKGKIILDEREMVFTGPKDSMEAGIAFIHQELNLINDLPIYENMFIGRELKKKNGTLDLERMLKETQEVFIRMNIKLNPKAYVRDLDASYKQIVEIARAMMMNASVIIMDEPTTSLTETEIARVFEMMGTLRSHDVGIIFISHKLNEVMAICDRYTVLRDGVMVGAGSISETNPDKMARLMVGHDVRSMALQRNLEKKGEILTVKNLSKEHVFKNISFSAYEGEILGITGLLGDGRSELFLSLFGADRYDSGEVLLSGKPVKIRSTFDAMRKGIGYLPRNRKENGIIKDMNIFENASIVTWPLFSRRGLIDRKSQAVTFDRQVNRLKIKMGKKTDNITSLSGGNQQKVVLSKWLAANPKILVLDNPTQGVDVGAKEDIYDIIMELIDEDIAVIVLSSEAQEIIRICDRALVMYHGEIRGELRGTEMNEHNIMKLATGGRMNQKEGA